MLISRISFCFFSLLGFFSNYALAVGGYSQVVLVKNNTNYHMSLYCSGGKNILRDKHISLPPHEAKRFISDALVEPFENLLGGRYSCSISLGNIQNRKFETMLTNAQEIRVWTVNPSFFATEAITCGREYFGNFNRPSAIISYLNQGGSYHGENCPLVPTS